MAKKDDITKEDLYGLLGVAEDATEKEVLFVFRPYFLKSYIFANTLDFVSFHTGRRQSETNSPNTGLCHENCN